jgi:hypothetical protein
MHEIRSAQGHRSPGNARAIDELHLHTTQEQARSSVAPEAESERRRKPLTVRAHRARDQQRIEKRGLDHQQAVPESRWSSQVRRPHHVYAAVVSVIATEARKEDGNEDPFLHVGILFGAWCALECFSGAR